MVAHDLAPADNTGLRNDTLKQAATVIPPSGPIQRKGTMLNSQLPQDPIAEQSGTRTTVAKPQSVGAEEPFEVAPESLSVRPWEAKFAERLAEFIPSPRAAKRFANIYRMLKASIDPTRVIEYEGTEKFPGDFQVPMTLLAMLIGAPAECCRLFPKLLSLAKNGNDVVGFLSQDSKAAAQVRSKAIQSRLNPLMRDPAFPRSPDLFIEWLPQVAKFSFDVGKSLVYAETDDDVSYSFPNVN